MEIALFNLLSNAIKYTPEYGKIIFRVTENNDEVVVAVLDNGFGIAAGETPRLFEKFYQAHSPKNTPVKSGFGIGLYLVKRFVEGHKGIVSFETSAGKGTSFHVILKKGAKHLEGETILDSQQYKNSILA